MLAEHPTLTGSDGKLPIFLYQFVGAGKSMFNAVDDTWRWRFRVGDRYFGRFWIQTIRFLARSKLLGQKQAEIQTDRRRYQRNQPIQIRVRFPNPGLAPATGEVIVQVEQKGQGSRKLTLKRAPGSREPVRGGAAAGGRRRLRRPPASPAGARPRRSPRATFRVEPPAGEMERIQMNESELVRAARLRGQVLHARDRGNAARGPAQAEKVPLDTDPPDPALEHLAGALPVPGGYHGGMGFEETETAGIIEEDGALKRTNLIAVQRIGAIHAPDV